MATPALPMLLNRRHHFQIRMVRARSFSSLNRSVRQFELA